MPREIDVRDFGVSRIAPQREKELSRLATVASGLLPGEHEVRVAGFDPTTGNPSALVSVNAPAEPGNFVQRASDYVRALRGVMGLAPSQPAEFQPDPYFQRTSSGAVAVHLQQQYHGLSIFQATQTVRFSPSGAVAATAGRAETVAEEPAEMPQLSVEEAVRRAAEHVAQSETPGVDQFALQRTSSVLDLSGFRPQVTAVTTDSLARVTVLTAQPFEGPVKAGLIWLKVGEQLRLTWDVVLMLPVTMSQFRTLVDASNGDILYSKELTRSLKARGNVFRLDASAQRDTTDFPVPWEQHGLPVPPRLRGTLPPDWADEDKQSKGNAVLAHLEDSGPTLAGRVQGSTLLFDPDPAGEDQYTLNAFFYCNLMHDFFYLLGFTEEDGNFQEDNSGQGGVAGDPVDARVYRGPVDMTASMLTLADGFSPMMRLGLFPPTKRHTALDATVVFHEFTHGVTNRLVGGPLDDRALEAPQSSGMGEGWGDYFACTITKRPVVGSWLTGRPGGIRGFPYDANFPVQTENFGKLGTGRYDEVHNIGEIWCAALTAVNREIGELLAMQLVVDALKLSPANPSFLDMRDAILAALGAKRAANQISQRDHDVALDGIWRAFSAFGMGPGAACNGSFLAGIRPDFSRPPEAGRPPSGAPQTSTPATPPGSIISQFELVRASSNGVDIRLRFIDEKERDDFEVIFNGWLLEYRRLGDRVRRARQGGSMGVDADRFGFPD